MSLNQKVLLVENNVAKKIMNVALVKTRVLCILTSKWVIRTPFAGWNHCFCVKTNFPQELTSFWVSTSVLCMFFVISCIFLPFFPHLWRKKMEKLVLMPKEWFQPAKGDQSTRLPVKIHNIAVPWLSLPLLL